jgi:hypothetical protein
MRNIIMGRSNLADFMTGRHIVEAMAYARRDRYL